MTLLRWTLMTLLSMNVSAIEHKNQYLFTCNFDTESLISDHQATIHQAAQVLLELRNLDVDELQATEQFQAGGCSCDLGLGGTPCCQQFSVSHYRDMRTWCAELTKDQRDCMVKGQLLAMTSATSLTKHSTTNHQEARKREHSYYYHQGLQICRATFLFLHSIHHYTFKALRRSCREEGMLPRVHGNTRRLPSNALTFNDVKHVVSFIDNYAEDHAILLPGRIPGYKRSDLQLLPCSTTKRSVWKEYRSATESSISIHSVAYTTFTNIWRKLLPHIMSTRPMTDLCAVCHQNAGLIMRSSNISEEEKSQVSKN